MRRCAAILLRKQKYSCECDPSDGEGGDPNSKTPSPAGRHTAEQISRRVRLLASPECGVVLKFLMDLTHDDTSNNWRSRPRASDKVDLTVPSVTPMTSAVSATLKPTK